MVNFGNTWEDCILMALRIEEAFGTRVADSSDVVVDITWDDPETRNEQAHLETLKSKLELGISKQQLWREMGYSIEDIEQMKEDQEQERVSETNIGAEILRNFNAGEI